MVAGLALGRDQDSRGDAKENLERRRIVGTNVPTRTPPASKHKRGGVELLHWALGFLAHRRPVINSHGLAAARGFLSAISDGADPVGVIRLENLKCVSNFSSGRFADGRAKVATQFHQRLNM